MNYHGVMIAAVCFLVIGVFHPIVIRAEYYFSSRCWPVFLLAGLLFLAASLAVALASVPALRKLPGLDEAPSGGYTEESLNP